MTSRALDVKWRCGSFAAVVLVALGLGVGAAGAADRWNDDAVMATLTTTSSPSGPAQAARAAGKVGFEFCGA